MIQVLISLLFALLATAQPVAAVAGEVKKLGIASAVGDVITVVVHRPEVGSSIDRNARQSFSLPDSGFDAFAVNAATAAAKANGQLAVETFDLGPVQSLQVLSWIEGQRFTPPAALQARLSASGLSHLMLIAVHRAPSRLKLAHSSVGSGTLEGLGFYIDRQKRVRRGDTGEAGIGFLAPYAYFQVLLINLESGEVEKSDSVGASRTASAARNKDGLDPWDALDAKQKVTAIQGLLRVELARVVPEILK